MRFCNRVLSFLYLAFVYFKCVLSGEECTSYDSQVGECKLPDTCHTIPFFRDVHRTRQQTEILRKIGCGFEGLTQKICCPLFEKCELLNGTKGECKDVAGCAVIKNITVLAALAFETSSCNTTNSNSFNVCCPTTLPVLSSPSTQPITPILRIHQTEPTPISVPTPTPTSTPISTQTPTPTPIPYSTSTSKIIRTCRATSLLPDPNEGCCGQEASASRILGGNETEVDQYPWLVLLEYRDNKVGTITTRCGGSLISGRYVLTAAHCVHESITNPPESVRIGEHDTRTNIDCNIWFGVPFCNNGSESIPIQKISVHSLYYTRTHENDIALVRLNRTVNFSAFVKPICLPSSATLPRNLYVAGWGATETGYASPVKMHVKIPHVDLLTCHAQYPRQRLSFGRICAGGEAGKSSCSGDSGGPLMHFTERRYEMVGIVSLGQRFCELGKPSIYTKVIDYLDWIRTHVHE